jgi:hypothetical protein
MLEFIRPQAWIVRRCLSQAEPHRAGDFCSLAIIRELIAFPSTERGKPHSMRLTTEIQLVAQFLDSASRAVL